MTARPAHPPPGGTLAVIPAYNEAEALPGVLEELARVVPHVDVVVIDDGSTDDTARVARNAGVTCIRLAFNMGIGGAIRAGYRFGAEQGYERAVQFDADGQHRADQVPLLLAALDSGAHLAAGNRFASGSYRTGVVRRPAMALLRVAVRMLCGQRFGDTTSGFRAVSQPLLKIFAEQYPVEYMDSTETLVAACRAGYRVQEVPVKMRQRAGGSPSVGRVRLVYHYARLGVALLGGSRTALPRAPADT